MTKNRARKLAEKWAASPTGALQHFADHGSLANYPSAMEVVRREIAFAMEQAKKLDDSAKMLDELFELRIAIEK